MLEEIKQKALQRGIPIIRDETLKTVVEILKEVKPEKVLEIGTAVGYSAICFSSYLPEKGKIDTIELDEQKVYEAIENIKKMNLENKIHVMVGNAVEILPTMQEKYDVIFIDAAKSKYPIFLEEAIRLSHQGSIIIADNVLYNGYVLGDYNKHKQRTAVTNLRKFLNEVQSNPKLETKLIEIEDGLTVSKVI